MIRIVNALRKDHRCTLCGRRIAVGTKYWADETGDTREHTNCELYVTEELLPEGYNQNRPRKKS